MIPENITREHVLEAIKEIESSKVPYHRESVNYDIIIDGKQYPPKYTISIANKYANNVELDSTAFDAPEARTFLSKLGFEIKLRKKSGGPEGSTGSIIIAKLAWSFNKWKGFDEEGYQKRDLSGYEYVRTKGLASEWWNFHDFNPSFYYGHIELGGKSPSNFKNNGLILLASHHIIEKKFYIIGFYGGADFGTYSNPPHQLWTTLSDQTQKMIENDVDTNKISKDILSELKEETEFRWRGEKERSTVFQEYIEFDPKEFNISIWGRAGFLKVGEGEKISLYAVKTILEKALIIHKNKLSASEQPEKEKLQEVVAKIQTVLDLYFSDVKKEQYWQIAPGVQAKDWEYCIENGIISIYANEYLKNLTNEVLDYDQTQLSDFFRKNNPEATPGQIATAVETIWFFTRNIKIGDYILANKGKSTALGWGIVTSGPKLYSGDKDITIYREVEWKDTNLNRSLTKDQGKNFFRAICPITNEEFDSIVNPVINYWGLVLIGNGENQEYWRFFKEKGIIGIGYEEYIDFIEKYGQKLLEFKTKEKFEKAFREYYPDKSPLFTWQLISEMKIGDIIVASTAARGKQQIVAEGIIKSEAQVDVNAYCRIFRYIDWQMISPPINIPDSIKGKFLHYYIKLTSDEYRQIMDKTGKLPPVQKLNNFKKQVILYGPPGTGKTYTSVIKAHEIIFGENDSIITYRTLQEKLQTQQKNDIDVSQLSWLEAIVLAFDETNKEKVQVDEIKKSRIIQEFSSYKNNRSIGNTIWFVLQTESRLDSDTVRSQKKSGREYFDKDSESNWYLTDKGKEFQRNLIDDLQALPETSDFQFSFITFHQSFSYEDFVEGIRPELNNSDESTISYRIKDGIFKEICKKAAKDPDNNYVLIIDEINRGNISKIFGELITLLEDNKRAGEAEEITVRLPYSNEAFSVPKNVYIIGTMNSTDKSIALVDIALRRRFHFERLNVNYEMIPNMDARAFLEELNKIICAIKNLDYEIGHSYFMKIPETDTENQELKNVFINQILPLLEEYFFNDWEALATIIGRDSIKIEERKKFVWNEDSGGDYDTVYGRCLKEPDIVFTNTLKNLQKQNTNKQEINP